MSTEDIYKTMFGDPTKDPNAEVLERLDKITELLTPQLGANRVLRVDQCVTIDFADGATLYVIGNQARWEGINED